MLTVSEPARQILKNLLDINAQNSEDCLRITRTEDSELTLMIDREKEGDNIVEQEGSKVLLVDSPLAAEMKDITLDVRESPEGINFVLLNNSAEEL